MLELKHCLKTLSHGGVEITKYYENTCKKFY